MVVVVLVVGATTSAAGTPGVAATVDVVVDVVEDGALDRQLRTLQLRRPDGHQGADEDRADGGGRADGSRHPGAPALQCAAPDRHFDQVVAEGGDGHRHAHPGQEERVDAPVQALPRHHQQHGPVPEVDAVGDAAPLRQGWQLQEAHHERARCGGAAQNDRTRRQAGHQEAAAEGEGGGLRRRRPQRGRSRHTGQGENRREAGEPAPAAPVPPQRQPDGDGGADQQGLRPRVGAVVGAGGVAVRRQKGHEEGRGQRAQAGDGEEDLQPAAADPVRVVVHRGRAHEEQLAAAEHVDGTMVGVGVGVGVGVAVGGAARGAAACRAELEHAEDHQRPHQVELLLDRQRPRVQQRRRLGGQREVRHAVVDGVPVREIEHRREGVAEDVRRGQQRRHDRQDDADDRDEKEECRQQAPGAPGPEAARGGWCRWRSIPARGAT